ncbi:MAG TPA: hypothetical protein VFK39_07355 [Gemmatimonadaceae bacterium]|nr:hypothetical protein [Gemmatimonadaceae bacterium]
MFIELVGSLRCVHVHQLSWLVVSAYRMEDRDIVSGELGCHICGARYPIEYGVADFRELGSEAEASRQRVPAAPRAPDTLFDTDPTELALRAAALLEITSPGGAVVLAGQWSAAARPLASGESSERVHVLALDPATDVQSGDGISIALTGRRPPLRPATVRGIALDEAHSDPSYVASIADSLRPGARLLAPISAPLPPGLAELTRDDRFWLASKGREVRVELKRG